MITKNYVLPVDVFVGGGGDVILCQEWPELGGEKYIRVFIHPEEAEDICKKIMAAARESQKA